MIFHHANGASLAFQKLNGLLIDNRPVKVSLSSMTTRVFDALT